MAPPIASAKLTLSYPVYSADFDPKDNGFLVVGGGGGEGRSGVGNKITLIDTHKKHEISEVVDISLSRDEDSVMSLAVAQSSDTSATILAGINSSTADQQAGKNEHLRSFLLEYPRLKKITGPTEDERVASTEGRVQTKALGKASLFTPATGTKKETYQRVLRLSRTHFTNGTRLGVIATGLAQEGEVIVFTIDSPEHVDVRRRIQLNSGQEAADIDLIQQESGDFLVTYCTDYEVYIFKISAEHKSTDSNGQLIHATPVATISGKRRPTFRSIRFLTSKLILILQNQPNRTGAELLLLEVPEGNDLGLIILRKVLHKTIKSASALSTALLAPSNPTQKAQHVIAVAGQDISITVLTLEQSLTRASSRSLKFRSHTILYNVHPLQMTALTFSNFIPPSDPSTAPPQYLKLASTQASHEDDADHDPEDDGEDEEDDEEEEDYEDDDHDNEDEGISSTSPELTSTPRSGNPQRGRILLRPHPSSSAFSAALHPKAHEEGKLWDELSHEQKERWKERLVNAGEWTVEEGEAVLKGVFFGQLGGLVGAIVGGL